MTYQKAIVWLANGYQKTPDSAASTVISLLRHPFRTRLAPHHPHLQHICEPLAPSAAGCEAGGDVVA
jgi:hypothetical protein